MMSTLNDPPARVAVPRPPLLPVGFDWLVFAALALGLAVMYGPAYYDLSHTVWATDEQGHGPIILAVAGWLLYGKRHELVAVPARPVGWLGWPLMVFALLLFALGRSQDIIMFAIGSQILLLVALLLVFTVIRPALARDKTEADSVPQLDAVVDDPQALPGPDGDEVPLLEAPASVKQLADAREMAMSNPLAVANILKGWVNGEPA